MSDNEKGPLQEAIAPVNDVKGAKQMEDSLKEKPLSRVNRVLTEEDLKSAGVRKMLLGQLDEYDQCKCDLVEVRNDFHRKDKECAVLTEKIKGIITFDWLYSALLTFGSILIGFYASQPDKGTILLWIGIVSVVLSFGLKVYRSHEDSIQ